LSYSCAYATVGTAAKDRLSCQLNAVHGACNDDRYEVAAAGDAVVSQGEPPGHFYIVLAGAVAVDVRASDGTTRTGDPRVLPPAPSRAHRRSLQRRVRRRDGLTFLQRTLLA